MAEHTAEKGLPDDGITVTVATRGMPGVFVGDRAVVRHQSPSGHSNIGHGLVWLECEVRWSHGTAQGFWASRSEYVIPPGTTERSQP